MIDVRQLREHADETCSALARRGDVTCDGQVKELLELDQQLREITARRDEARAKINELSREVGQLRRDGNVEQAEAVQAESRALGDEVGRIEGEHETVSAKMHDLLLH
ncbi:MAG: serine--tRNA ligase, partial [Ilumatobacteraceae bacterium]